MDKKPVITIDGPAGAGKSTISKILAQRLGYLYLDYRRSYRGLAYKAVKCKMPVDEISALSDLCSTTKVELKNIDGRMKVFVDDEDVEDKIRTEEVGLAASTISAFAVVRAKLLNLQRETGLRGGIIAEGRDMGSVVFPDADYKFYLDATFGERTKRRHQELLLKDNLADYQSIQKDMMIRDSQDSQREIAPLKAPAGAFIINSDNLSIEEVVEKIMSNISSG